MGRADVVVIGGGVMGASVAYWLTRLMPGLQVLVIDRGKHAGEAAPISSPVHCQFEAAARVQMARFGIGFLRDLQANLAIENVGGPPVYTEAGILRLATTQADAALQRCGGAEVEMWAADRIRARFPWIETGDLCAGHFAASDAGWSDGLRLSAGFRAAAREQGVRFATDAVTGFRMHAGRVIGVALESGTVVPCGAVVIAAGPHSGQLVQLAGLDLPVEARKRTVFVLAAPNAQHPDAPVLMDKAFHLRPQGPHWIIAPPPQDDIPCHPDDHQPDLRHFEDVIWERLFHRCPGFDAVKVVGHWVETHDHNALDHTAVLGPHPAVANLHVIAGFGGDDLAFAPAAGRGVAEHVLTGKWRSLDLSALSAARLSEGRSASQAATA